MPDLAELESRIKALDESLRPIAKRRVDLTNPNWMTLLKQKLPALDEAGIRTASDDFLGVIIDDYQRTNEAGRKAIRALFEKCDSYSWAATLAVPPTTEDGFLQHMILFSIKDHGRDTRDAILTLQNFCKQANAAGVNTSPILQKVAQLSSGEDRYGMGSIKSIILRAA